MSKVFNGMLFVLQLLLYNSKAINNRHFYFLIAV
jgi:hypothetical protein